MSFDTFMQTVLAQFPEATIDTDNDGQLVIYTNLREIDNDVVPFVAE